MLVTVLYVGASLLAPLRQAEREINEKYSVNLRIATHNCSLTLDAEQWSVVRADLADTDIVFVIHITDGENGTQLGLLLDEFRVRHHAVISINCLPDLMRKAHMGKLDFSQLMKPKSAKEQGEGSSSQSLVRKLGSWIADYVKERNKTGRASKTTQYLKFINRLPTLLRFVPGTGKLRDIKNYLYIFCYFLQPTPDNIRSMVLYAIQQYLPGYRQRIQTEAPAVMPALGIYHPDAKEIFASVDSYQQWYKRARQRPLDANTTIGLLLMRPQVISGAHQHYDGLIRAIEAEGLSVLPILSTLMDNREASDIYFIENGRARVSQLLSLTGFSFVGGPAMNDSEAAVAYLNSLGLPLRSAISLDMQMVESWQQTQLGLNPVQTAMQIALPEIDGATEPLIFGGLHAGDNAPLPLPERCRRIARRLAHWNRLRTTTRAELRLAFIIYCFPPNKGNIGTAADLDVFPSLWEILQRLKSEGYTLSLPENANALRTLLLDGNSTEFGMVANVAYRMNIDEYRRLCPYIDEIEAEWGAAPGQINAHGREVLILGVELGNIFIGIQPTFGYEGDPMRLLMAQGGAPHHGFMGLYTYLADIFHADAVVHVGTHGALEFMPGKQAGLSEKCWPDRLIGEFPNIYIYSVNNPSEGSIAKRRSYAELISYLTPPIENAGLYKELISLKELLTLYRQTTNEQQRAQLFATIEEKAQQLNFKTAKTAINETAHSNL
ncbi:MAG: cobaltochelatase subunit CobN [Acidobacteriota bacterium]